MSAPAALSRGLITGSAGSPWQQIRAEPLRAICFQRAKSELIQLCIAEKQRHLIPLEEAVCHMEKVVGLFLSHLSGFAARYGGRDLAARRVIDQAVYDLRLEISQAATKLADQRGELLDDDA